MVWDSMKRRCYNKNHKSYKDYGGRGIIICEIWLHNFKVFYDWAITHNWIKGLLLDRIDNDGNYEPNNCRFVTNIVSANNMSTNIVIEAFNEKHTAAEWSRDNRCLVSYSCLIHRIKKGIHPELALTVTKRIRY
jgi:hypothetical protein